MFITEYDMVVLVRIISTAAMVIAGGYVFFHNPQKLLNRLFFLITLVVLWFETVFIVLRWVSDPHLAYWVTYGAFLTFLLVPLMPHFMLIAIGEGQRGRFYIYAMYVVAAVGIVGSVVSPSSYITGVGPKGIFPWILIPGPLYHLMANALTLSILYPMYRMVLSYIKNPQKNPAGYYILFFSMSFPIGYSTAALILDYPLTIPPVFGSLMGVALLPIAYGIIADDLLDIRIVAKQALLYSVGIGASVALATLLISLNNFLVSSVAWVQFWTIPVLSGVSAFIIGRLFWLETRESDRLKYEFITVAAHKLRTPLTQINWSVNALQENSTLSQKARKDLEEVQSANSELIALTDTLLHGAQTEPKQIETHS